MSRKWFCVLSLCFVSLATAQIEEKSAPIWRQNSEVQTTSLDPKPASDSSDLISGLSAAEFATGPTPKWIWGADENKNYQFRKSFEVGKVKAAFLKASCDNVARLFLNGERLIVGRDWNTPMAVDVTSKLKQGKNVLSARVSNEGGVAGFVFKLIIKDDKDQVTYIVSDTDWNNFKSEDKLVSKGNYGTAPWGKVFDNDSERQRAKDPFDVLPGYRVEKLFTVPKDQLGSWVCIAEDNKGRLLASDQGNKGICRITLPKKSADGGPAETVVERLDFSGCDVQPSGAQGMLWAFDSLYISINGGPGSGFYRARDTDGDDKFDECVLLKKLNGGGEHGPHSLRLSPDGKRIFLIAGNHTEPPFRAGEETENSDYSSQIPTNWGEDLLLPRMWDANGHARGKLAPGGWIASTDPDGKTWDIWSIGYRNPYDMAFNADGELFAYDADMEWDVGSPWYRPTRVVHATRGSEFGWRSGTGKWPTHYLDSLPPMVDIGPGSPVGVDFGYNLDFPAKYQKALFICDWTFGTMYAIHIQPRGSSYTGTKEEFVARNALPLTDVVAASDGALYFTIGGRGTQSELYRVTYVGNESTAPTQLEDGLYRSDRENRRKAEMAADDAASIATALGSADRFTRYTGLVNAYDNVPLPNRLTNDRARIAYLAALARKQVDQPKDEARLSIACNQTLDEIRYGSLSSDLKLDYLRAVSLCFIRKPAIIEPWMDRIASSIESDFPSGNPERDRELCQLLVYLESPTVVEKTIELMKRESPRPTTDMKALLSRNSGYARAFNAMMKNQPDKQQIWYAFCLRVAEAGWTPETRAEYFRWFGKAQKWAGGNSFRKFLQNIENQAYEGTTENERVMLEAAGARSPFTMPELPSPAGPGHKWELAEVRNLVNDGLKERNFENGKKMFAATRCILCHRFAGDGGATGPDLTQLAGRFNVEALSEAIMEPSKVISDQYVASTVYTDDGKSVSGRIVSENSEQISVLTDPEDSTKVVDIAKDNIEEITPSKASIMPSGLLDQLNENEVLDLFAYLLSRGDSRNKMFKKK